MRRLGVAMRISLFAYVLVAPVVLLILGLVAYPFLYAIYVSFTDQVVGNVGKWIGLRQLPAISLGTRPSSAPIWNTIVIVARVGRAEALIGLGLALLVNQHLPARGIFRSFLMLPWAMPAFVAFLTWRVLYQPIGGGINLILTETGIYPHVVDWLGQRSTAMRLGDRRLGLARLPVLVRLDPRRAAGGAERALRGGARRRRQCLAALLGRDRARHPAGGDRHRRCCPRSGPPTASSTSGC